MEPRTDTLKSELASTKRRHVRFAFTAKAEILVAGDPKALKGTMLDLSKEGCLLMLAEPCLLESGIRLDVLFRLNQKAFRLGGTVKTQRSDNRIAVQFDRIDAGVGRQLATLPSARSRGRDYRRDEPLTSD